MGRNITLEAGAWVMDGDHMRRIVTYMDGNAVLEIWNNGALLQYCVAQDIRITHEQFTWMNGTYFICSDFKSPALALVRAMSRFAELCDIRTDVSSQTSKTHFTLPNGIRIQADLCGDALKPDAGNGWSSLDISAVFPDGRAETLCCVDFEDQNEAGLSHGLRILAYKPEDDEPSIVQPYPVENCSIWLSHENEDDTWDINIWDEDANQRRESLEVYRIGDLLLAQEKMADVQRANPIIRWSLREVDEKHG